MDVDVGSKTKPSPKVRILYRYSKEEQDTLIASLEGRARVYSTWLAEAEALLADIDQWRAEQQQKGRCSGSQRRRVAGSRLAACLAKAEPSWTLHDVYEKLRAETRAVEDLEQRLAALLARAAAAGTRKRATNKPSLQDLQGLLAEAAALPVEAEGVAAAQKLLEKTLDIARQGAELLQPPPALPALVHAKDTQQEALEALLEKRQADVERFLTLSGHHGIGLPATLDAAVDSLQALLGIYDKCTAMLATAAEAESAAAAAAAAAESAVHGENTGVDAGAGDAAEEPLQPAKAWAAKVAVQPAACPLTLHEVASLVEEARDALKTASASVVGEEDGASELSALQEWIGALQLREVVGGVNHLHDACKRWAADAKALLQGLPDLLTLQLLRARLGPVSCPESLQIESAIRSVEAFEADAQSVLDAIACHQAAAAVASKSVPGSAKKGVSSTGVSPKRSGGGSDSDAGGRGGGSGSDSGNDCGGSIEQPKPTLEQVSALVTRGRNLRATLRRLKDLEVALNAANQFASKVRVEFAGNKSGKDFRVHEALAPLAQMATAVARMQKVRERNASREQNENARFCHCHGSHSGLMVCCELCRNWYHGRCEKVTRNAIADGLRFLCSSCRKTRRPPASAVRALLHTIAQSPVALPEQAFIANLLALNDAWVADATAVLEGRRLEITAAEADELQLRGDLLELTNGKKNGVGESMLLKLLCLWPRFS